MANNEEESKPSADNTATTAGMVEAIEQDVELIVDKVMDTAGDAVVAVQEKLGMRKPPRAKKSAQPKPKAKAPAVKAKAPATKMKAPAAKAKVSKAVKTAPRMVAKSIKRAAKPAPSKGKKAKGRR
jgi:hypothetical protein